MITENCDIVTLLRHYEVPTYKSEQENANHLRSAADKIERWFCNANQ